MASNNSPNNYGFNFSNAAIRNSLISIGATVKQGNVNISSVYDPNRKTDGPIFENSFVDINSNVERKDLDIQEIPQGARLVAHKLPTQLMIQQTPSNPPQSSSIQLPKLVEQTLAPQATVAQPKSISVPNVPTTKRSGDTVFIINGAEISAFKGILSAKSPVFAAKIKSMPNDKIPLHGITPDIFEAMLKYFDDDNFDVRPYAEQLLEVSHKYKINGLKTKCEDILKQNISFNSAVKFLELAEKHHAENLKTKCVEYIRECPSIQLTDRYRKLLEDNPSLIIDFD